MKSDAALLAEEMGISLADLGFMYFMNDTKEVQKALVGILEEERGYEKSNDSRFNPERKDMADRMLIDIIAILMH